MFETRTDAPRPRGLGSDTLTKSVADRSRETGGTKTTRARPALSGSPGERPRIARVTRASGRAGALVALARADSRSSLVDPASSHMLVSKIKPCMSQCMPN